VGGQGGNKAGTPAGRENRRVSPPAGATTTRTHGTASAGCCAVAGPARSEGRDPRRPLGGPGTAGAGGRQRAVVAASPGGWVGSAIWYRPRPPRIQIRTDSAINGFHALPAVLFPDDSRSDNGVVLAEDNVLAVDRFPDERWLVRERVRRVSVVCPDRRPRHCARLAVEVLR